MKSPTKVTKFVLFKRITDKVIEDYSLFKLGDPAVTEKYAKQLSEVIKIHLPENRKTIVYATNKYPTNIYEKKNSLLLAEGVAERLKTPLIIGEYRYTPGKKFYDDQLKRKMVYKPRLRGKRVLRNRNYHVVMIDDSIVSGLALRTSLAELKQITDSVDFFSVINLRRNTHSEKNVNDFAFSKAGISILINVIKKPGYVFTSHFLRTFEKLANKERRAVLKGVSQKQGVRLRKAFKLYFNKRLRLR